MNTKHTHMVEAARHAASVVNYIEQAGIDAKRGKRHMAFWCLDMAARHRLRYIAERAAIKREWAT
jgi:hypothetical protein